MVKIANHTGELITVMGTTKQEVVQDVKQEWGIMQSRFKIWNLHTKKQVMDDDRFNGDEQLFLEIVPLHFVELCSNLNLLTQQLAKSYSQAKMIGEQSVRIAECTEAACLCVGEFTQLNCDGLSNFVLKVDQTYPILSFLFVLHNGDMVTSRGTVLELLVNVSGCKSGQQRAVVQYDYPQINACHHTTIKIQFGGDDWSIHHQTFCVSNDPYTFRIPHNSLVHHAGLWEMNMNKEINILICSYSPDVCKMDVCDMELYEDNLPLPVNNPPSATTVPCVTARTSLSTSPSVPLPSSNSQ